MYDLINQHFDKLLGTVGQADIEPYVWMIREFQTATSRMTKSSKRSTAHTGR
jgi:hypothetical protein